MARKRKQDSSGKQGVMPVMRADAAGIDIGATGIRKFWPNCATNGSRPANRSSPSPWWETTDPNISSRYGSP